MAQKGILILTLNDGLDLSLWSEGWRKKKEKKVEKDGFKQTKKKKHRQGSQKRHLRASTVALTCKANAWEDDDRRL